MTLLIGTSKRTGGPLLRLGAGCMARSKARGTHREAQEHTVKNCGAVGPCGRAGGRAGERASEEDRVPRGQRT